MRLQFFFAVILLCFLEYSAFGQDFNEAPEHYFHDVDTILITSSGYKLRFSDSIFNMPYIRYLGRGLRCIDPRSFSREGGGLRSKTILANLNGIHEIPFDSLDTFKVNDITWTDYPVLRPHSSVYHTEAVLFDSFFEDVLVEPGDNGNVLLLHHTVTYLPEGYVKYEVVYIRRQPYILIKANINGVLYVEWFRFGDSKQAPSYLALKYTTRGIGIGVGNVLRGVGFVGRNTVRGTLTGAGHTLRGVNYGVKRASIGRYVFNEAKMFYKPSREFEEMDDLLFEEKPIDVENGITIHNYYFKCDSPKANIFLIHGNGGNVSAYKSMINTLVAGRYNICAVDWRGYGKSTGKPDYKGVLKDTQAAFDDFIASTRSDSLKTIVYGMSLGGQIATKLVSARQDETDGLVLDGCLSSALNLTLDFIPTFILRNNVRSNADVFNQEYVAEKDIKSIENIPKLIIHSETDNVVLFYHGERIFRNATEPKFFWKTDTEHIRTLDEFPDEAIKKIDQLLISSPLI